MSLEELGRSIACEQDALLHAEHDLQTVRTRLALLGSSPPGRRWRGWAGAALAAAAIAIVVLVVVARREPKLLSFTIGAERVVGTPGLWLSAADQRGLKVDFSDGSRLLLAHSARARVATVDAQGAGIVVEAGQAEFNITPSQRSSWRVTLGPFVVAITGTRFSVAWNPEKEILQLVVQEGRVAVSGCVFGDGRGVSAGETLRVSCKDRWMEITSHELATALPPSPSATVAVSAAAVPAAGPSGAPVPSPVPSEGRAPRELVAADAGRALATWRFLLARGDYGGAFSAAQAAGFAELCRTEAAADVLALADAARLSGNVTQAEDAYRAVRQRFPYDAPASVAAFMLARIAFDQRGDYGSAITLLQSYLREQPGGPLAREALGRLIEARQRSGDDVAARRAAQEYLARYPTGPHAELAQQLLRK
jgi:TolA-binding protein